jgi:hypothetical protein
LTSEHLFFIPSVFFLGLFIGAAIPNLLTHNKVEQRDVKFSPKMRGSLLASLFGAFCALFILTHMLPFTGGAKSLHSILGHQALFDQRPSATADEVYDRIDSFGEGSREAYMRFTYSGDVVVPFSLLVLLTVVAYFVRERVSILKSLYPVLIFTPLLWFFTDMTENFVIYYLISQYPQKNIFLAERLAIITYIKFGLLFGSIALPAVSYAFYKKSYERKF